MVGTVTINTITGTSDYDVWISNGCEENQVKVYIDTITNSDIPYTFNVPTPFQNSAFCVKIYDSNDCEICECFGVAPSPSPSVTPTMTPSITVSPTMTPTPTPSPTCNVPTYLNGVFVGNGFESSATYTLSSTQYNGRNQWVSTNNGIVRWNGFRWEIAQWTLGGVIYYNTNTLSINGPDNSNWTYTNCGKGFTCSISFTSSGCGEIPEISPTPTITPTSSITPTSIVSPTPTPTQNQILTCSSSVVPPTTINGVSITESSTGDVGTYGGTSTVCNNITTPVNSKFLGNQGSSFTYTMNFSVSVNNIVIFLAGAGDSSGLCEENFIFTTNSGGGVPTISSTESCFSTIVGNEILSGLGCPPEGGGGKFLITNPVGFTSLTISGDGGCRGAILSICSNSI